MAIAFANNSGGTQNWPEMHSKALKIHAFMELAFSRIIQEEYKNIPAAFNHLCKCLRLRTS